MIKYPDGQCSYTARVWGDTLECLHYFAPAAAAGGGLVPNELEYIVRKLRDKGVKIYRPLPEKVLRLIRRATARGMEQGGYPAPAGFVVSWEWQEMRVQWIAAPLGDGGSTEVEFLMPLQEGRGDYRL